MKIAVSLDAPSSPKSRATRLGPAVGPLRRRLGVVVGVVRTSIALGISPLVASMAFGEAADRPVSTQLAFDRNQLRDVRIAGSNAVALTVAGHQLRFSVPDLVLRGESLSNQPVVALGQGAAGEIFAMRGREVLSVDPISLALTRVADFPERVIWAQRDRRGRVLAITEKGEAFEPHGRTLRRAGMKAIALSAEDAVAHLSSRGEVFLGADRGEFGGWVAYVDLRSGRVRTRKSDFDGV